MYISNFPTKIMSDEVIFYEKFRNLLILIITISSVLIPLEIAKAQERLK